MRVIVCLTSIPARNGTLRTTLASLATQSRAPDEIRLYGDANVAGDGHPVIRVRDRGPVTKLTAAGDHELAPDDVIVTCDDDVTYPVTWLEHLVAASELTPNAAIGFSGWNASDFLLNGERGYYIWANPGYCDVLEGFAGVAYRRGFFTDDVLEPPEAFRWVDDVWISSYLHKRSIPRRVIRGPHGRAQERLPGLHNRPDFLKLNRNAAILGFK
jgi:hypothetical protein